MFIVFLGIYYRFRDEIGKPLESELRPTEHAGRIVSVLKFSNSKNI
jgi:hypothetical protein